MQAGSWFSKKRLFVVLMLLSLVAAVFGGDLTWRFRQLVRMLIWPLDSGGMYVVTALRPGAAGGLDAGKLSTKEIEQLQLENQRLRQQLTEVDLRLSADLLGHQKELENLNRVRSSFSPHDDLPCELIPARVVAMDSLPYAQTRVLNRGWSAGAVQGAPALSRLLLTDRAKEMPPHLAAVTASALVGRISASGAFTAELQLVTDRDFHIRSRIQRIVDANRPRQVQVVEKGGDGAKARAAIETLTLANNRPIEVMASGDGAGGLVVDGVPEGAKVAPGDWLVTPDDDDYLRAEVRIGYVEEVRPSPSGGQYNWLRVRPFEDLAALRHVYIVYWKPL